MTRIDLHIRLPKDLHQQLALKADRLGISLNALIVIQLREMQNKWSNKPTS